MDISNKILSVIVPSYNVERFLKKNVSSMLDDSIMKDIEILIIDDGSTDNTGVIADEFAAMYPETIKAIHKKNGGHGSTINVGITAATGKYFFVLDADDWMDTNNFIKLISYLNTIDSDLIFFDFDIVSEDEIILNHAEYKCFPNGNEFQIEDFIASVPVLKNNRYLSIHSYCIKTKILFDNNVRCHENHYYVDQEYILYSLCHVKTAIYLPITVEKYLCGYVQQSSSVKSKQKNCLQYKEVMEFLVEFYNKNSENFSKNLQYYYCRHISWFNTGLYSTYLSFKNMSKSKTELFDFDIWLREEAPKIYSANKNIAVFALRVSRFSLFKLGAFLYQIIDKSFLSRILRPF